MHAIHLAHLPFLSEDAKYWQYNMQISCRSGRSVIHEIANSLLYLLGVQRYR